MQNQQTLELTDKEALLLQLLLRAAPRLVVREQLLADVWGHKADLETHTLETHVYRLRKKLATLDLAGLLHSATGGYSWGHDAPG
jgi:DNA-binding response OmpR family regulator